MGRYRSEYIIVFLALFLGACQSAPSGTTAMLTPISPAMPQGSPAVNPPPGFVSFCLRFQDQCTSKDSEPSILALTPSVWSELVAVNARVNTSIWPVEDQRHYGQAEFWTIPSDGYGDCDDYALSKRQQLAKLGLPIKALRVAVVVTGRNDRHAVLTVVTDHGDFVLDNQTNEILPWNQTNFRWLARQDAKNDWGWISFESSPMAVAAASVETRSGAQ